MLPMVSDVLRRMRTVHSLTGFFCNRFSCLICLIKDCRVMLFLYSRFNFWSSDSCSVACMTCVLF